MLGEEELQSVVVGTDDESVPPEVGPPMPDRLHQTYEFAFVWRGLEVACGKRLAEEGDRPVILVQHRAEARAGGVAVDDEVAGEVRQVEDGRCR